MAEARQCLPGLQERILQDIFGTCLLATAQPPYHREQARGMAAVKLFVCPHVTGGRRIDQRPLIKGRAIGKRRWQESVEHEPWMRAREEWFKDNHRCRALNLPPAAGIQSR